MGNRQSPLEELGVSQALADSEKAAKKNSGRRTILKYLQLAAGLAITVLCFVYIFNVTDIPALRAALLQFDWRFGFLALAALSLGYLLRIYRWAVMLRVSAPTVSTTKCASPYLASIALNNLLPFRSGDVIRAFVFPKAIGITRSQSLATLIFERFLDLIILLVILSLGINAIGATNTPQWLIASMTALLGLCGIAVLLTFFGRRAISSFLHQVERIEFVATNRLFHNLLGFSVGVFGYVAELTKGSRLGGVILLSVGIWCLEATVFAAVMAGLGDPVSLTGVALIAGLATIATLAPSSPGYFGPFHLAAFESYQILFGDPGRAAAMAVLSHAAIWGPTTIAGTVAIVISWRRFGFSKLRNS